MKTIIIVGIFIQILYAQSINQKIILGAYKDTHKAAESLYQAEKLFEQDIRLKQLKESNHLSLQLELLEPYVMIVLKPITDVEIKNKLQVLLQYSFPEKFGVNNSNTKPSNSTSRLARNQKTPYTISKKVADTVKTNKPIWMSISIEWIGLILLAFAGFLLIFRSAKQMRKIKHLQEEMQKYQNKTESQMHKMEQENV